MSYTRHRQPPRYYAGETTEKTTNGYTRLPWGKHQGKTFDQTPSDYLRWLLTADACRPEWAAEITATLLLRHSPAPHH